MPTRRELLLGAGCAAVAGLGARGTARAGSAGQSPIDIRSRDAVAAPGGPLLFDYAPAVDLTVEYVHRDGDEGCRVRGREETVEAGVPTGAGSVHRAGERFELLQYHFHTPSEHTLDGTTFPMEQHFVHRSPAGKLLVVALFLVAGGHRTPQDEVLATLPDECGEPVSLTDVGLRGSLPHDLTGYHYAGSLTTSPYTAGVRWYVLREPLAIGVGTVTRFRELFPDGNARGVQPRGGRQVQVIRGRATRPR
jgi:carbonic anhydrase